MNRWIQGTKVSSPRMQRKSSRPPVARVRWSPLQIMAGIPTAVSGDSRGERLSLPGGDSGIGRAVALAFAREGADVAVNYLENTQDAWDAQRNPLNLRQHSYS